MSQYTEQVESTVLQKVKEWAYRNRINVGITGIEFVVDRYIISTDREDIHIEYWQDGTLKLIRET